MLEENLNPFIKNNQERNIFHKKQIIEFISPINYSWKQLYKITNKIKILWRMDKFDINYTLNMQELHKIIYTNLKYCNKIPNLKLKNKILESDINSFFQSNLFDILPKEKKLYDLYDNLFSKKQYIPKKDENGKIFFEELIIKFKDLYYLIQKNNKSMKQLKKMRWYMILDEDNFFEEQFKKQETNIFDLKTNNFLIYYNNSKNNDDDSFDETEKKNIYNEYLEIENNKIEDNLEEIYEKYIINDEIIDKLLKQEKNHLFYLIKLIYITISTFCKSAISHLLYVFLNTEETKREERKAILINEYLKFFNNFIDSCSIIDDKCVNINLAMNYLYQSLFEDYPKFPKFSIYRMCLKIWFAEINTHLIGKNTLLYEIRDILSSTFSETLKEELLNKMKQKDKYDNFQTKSMNYEKSKSFNLSTSFLLFNSFNNPSFTNQMNNLNPSFGMLNVYDDGDKQYKILEKGLSIINDTFSNEYSVYYLNSSKIDTNNFYENLVYNLENSITYYISEVFNVYIYDKKSCVKSIIDNIFDFFDNYFFKKFLIPNLRNKIYEAVYSSVKENLMQLTKNKFIEKDTSMNNNKEININKNSVFGSDKTICSSGLGSSSVFDLDADELGKNFNFSENVQIKTGEYKKEIINYIIKNTSFESSNAYLYTQIEQKLEIINEQINLYDLCTSISNWYYEHINMIKQNDQRVKDEIWKLQINIPNKFNQTKRYLLSYSLQYDWEFIKKVKILEKDYKINQDDDGMIEENNFDDDLGNKYFGDLDNIGQGNNMNVDDGFNLKSSYFDC